MVKKLVVLLTAVMMVAAMFATAALAAPPEEWSVPVAADLTGGQRPTVWVETQNDSSKLYHVWYYHYNDSTATSGYLLHTTSTDLEEWTLPKAATGLPVDAKCDSVFVMKVDGYFYLFGSVNTDIVLYTSPDGDVWTSVGSVLSKDSLGAWAQGKIDCPMVMYDESTNEYRLFFQGYQANVTNDARVYQLGMATSQTLTGQFAPAFSGEPTMVPGGSGTWDNGRLFQPWVIQEDNGTLVMFYSNKDQQGISYATSTDGGAHWNKYNQGLINIACEPAVVADGGHWVMFFMRGNEVYHATSLSAVTMTATIAWEVGAVGNPSYPQVGSVGIAVTAELDSGSLRIRQGALGHGTLTVASTSSMPVTLAYTVNSTGAQSCDRWVTIGGLAEVLDANGSDTADINIAVPPAAVIAGYSAEIVVTATAE